MAPPIRISPARTALVLLKIPRHSLSSLGLAISLALLPIPHGTAQDVLMHHNDPYRSGVQSHESQLTPSTVVPSTFAKLFSLPVDGQVYAQPLWVGSYTMADGKAHNVLVVATEHDSVYAFDADGKNPAAGFYWHVNLLGAGETTVPSPDDTGTTDIVPEIGITGTPVIDRVAGVVYLVAKSKLAAGNTVTYYQRLHALSLSTGAEMMGGPEAIQASVSGTGDGSSNGTVAFDPLKEAQRASLVLADGSVWIAWASHGDNGPYHGWVMGFNAAHVTQPTGVFNDTPNGGDGGIWMSGGGISTDASGNLYAASGNGSFDANTGGGDYATTVMKFTPSGGALNLVTSFTPYDQSNLSAADEDMGTSACTLIDNTGGKYPHLLVTTDKDGQIYLVDRDLMGGYMQNSNADVQDFSDGGYQVHSSFAFFNNRLYLAPDGGPLSVWTFNPTTGLFATAPATAGDSTFGCNGCNGSGGTPSVSANGTTNAIVWILDDSAFGNGPAVLHAFSPALDTEYYSSAMAANNRDQADVAVKFTTPTIANGFVYAGGNSSVTVYGLLKNAPPTTAAPVFSPAAGLERGPINVTITDKTAGAAIYYTLDGSSPTISSTRYTAPVAVNATTTLQAIAVGPGLPQSVVAQAAYILGVPGNVFGLNSGMSASLFDLNGSAQVVNNRLRLTDGGGNEAGSAYFHVPIRIRNFSSSFDFQMSQANADGMTFVIQNQGPAALGGTGGGLGYGSDTPGGPVGITPSIAVKFDLYNNAGEGIDSTGVYLNGASPTTPAVDMSSSPVDLHSGHIFNVQLASNGASLAETITDTATGGSFTHTYPVATAATLGSDTALIGFTGGTGGLTTTADILNWSWNIPPAEYFPTSGLPATVSSGAPALQSWSDSAFPAGAGVLFPATAKGQSVSFTVNATANALFRVLLLTDTGPNRAGLQLAVDGVNAGSVANLYAATPAPLTISFGEVLLTPGNHTFKFTVIGKVAQSTGYGLTFGELTLAP